LCVPPTTTPHLSASANLATTAAAARTAGDRGPSRPSWRRCATHAPRGCPCGRFAISSGQRGSCRGRVRLGTYRRLRTSWRGGGGGRVHLGVSLTLDQGPASGAVW